MYYCREWGSASLPMISSWLHVIKRSQKRSGITHERSIWLRKAFYSSVPVRWGPNPKLLLLSHISEAIPGYDYWTDHRIALTMDKNRSRQWLMLSGTGNNLIVTTGIVSFFIVGGDLIRQKEWINTSGGLILLWRNNGAEIVEIAEIK